MIARGSSVLICAVIDISPEQFLQDHTFTVEMEDASGGKLTDFKIDGGFRVAPSPDSRPGESGRMPLAIPLTGVTLPRAGDYWFVLSIDGDELARYRVRVAQVGVLTQQLSQAPDGEGNDSQEEE